MGFVHLYGRIATATLGTLLGVCVFLAGVKFIRRRAKLVSLLVRAQGALFAVLMGGLAAMGVYRGFAKLPQNYGIVALWNYGNEALGIVGEAQSHNALLTQLHNYTISQSDISNGYRPVETREGCRIVGREAFDASQIHEPWLARGGYKDKMRVAPYGWMFPWRDGILEGITVFSEGELRVNVHTNYFPLPFDAPLAVVPSFNWNLLPGGVSNVFWYAVSPSNSLVVTWENSPVSQDVNSITNFQAELFADGSFEYRYDDQTVGYAPVFPFDWDNDGLENTIDPEPLVAGPDAHGTNEEWHNVVCASIVNSNAYYLVDVVATRGPVPIRFNADRESLLGSPVVIARGGETNHVPLLMGVEYAVTSAEPFSLSAPSNVVVTMTGPDDGRAFNVQWPLSFELSPDSGGYTVDVQPFDPGGAFSWTPSMIESGGPRLLSGGSSCPFSSNGSWIGFTGCGSCECGVCSIDGTYILEGAHFATPSLWCGCTAVGPDFPGVPTLPASVSVGFDRAVVFYEDAYTNAPNDIVARHSTTNTLFVSAYGGESGGRLRIGQQNMDKLHRIGGAKIKFPYSAVLPPRARVSFSVEYEAAKHSAAEYDIAVDASVTPIGSCVAVSTSASNTVVKVQLTAKANVPKNDKRHIYGVREEVICATTPRLPHAAWQTPGSGYFSPWGNTQYFVCPLFTETNCLTVTHASESYVPLMTVLEPTGIVAVVSGARKYNLPKGAAGGIGLLTQVYIKPLTVSFGGIAFEEVPSTNGTHSGYFSRNCWSNAWYHTRSHGAGKWRNLGPDNFMMTDEAAMRKECGTPWEDGYIRWVIPVGWNEHNTTGRTPPVKLCRRRYFQTFGISPDGTVGVMKFGHVASRETNDVVMVNGDVIQ